jgi:hypothetical protein
MLKPFMHEKTKNKVQIYSHDAKQWKAAILEDFDPEELPACYGGTKTDPDGNPNCITMVSPLSSPCYSTSKLWFHTNLFISISGQYGRRSSKILLSQRKVQYFR